MTIRNADGVREVERLGIGLSTQVREENPIVASATISRLQAYVSPACAQFRPQFKTNYLQPSASLKPTHSQFKANQDPKKSPLEVNRDHNRECLILRVQSKGTQGGKGGLWEDTGVSPSRDSFLGSLTLFLDWGIGVLRLVKDPVYTSSKLAANRGLTMKGRS